MKHSTTTLLAFLAARAFGQDFSILPISTPTPSPGGPEGGIPTVASSCDEASLTQCLADAQATLPACDLPGVPENCLCEAANTFYTCYKNFCPDLGVSDIIEIMPPDIWALGNECEVGGHVPTTKQSVLMSVTEVQEIPASPVPVVSTWDGEEVGGQGGVDEGWQGTESLAEEETTTSEKATFSEGWLDYTETTSFEDTMTATPEPESTEDAEATLTRPPSTRTSFETVSGGEETTAASVSSRASTDAAAALVGGYGASAGMGGLLLGVLGFFIVL